MVERIMPNGSANSKAVAAETIFTAALAFPATERAAYLADACKEDEPLRRRVEALLQACDAPDGFLPEKPVNRSSDEVPPLTQKEGDFIGPYKLLEKLGEGGFG